MSADNLDAVDLAAVVRGGIINEDVLQAITDVSNIPLPFSDRVGTMSSRNQFREWTQDRLQDVDLDNAAVDGSDFIKTDENTGDRVGNRHQILTKDIAVSTRARTVDTVGFSDTLAYQIMMRTREARRDLEAISLENQGSVADDGGATAGRLGALGSWLTTNTERGVGGADGGFSGTGFTTPPTPGTARGLTETLVRDVSQAVWESGGNTDTIMSTPAMIRGLSEFLFDESARIATLRREAGPGVEAATAIGSVNLFLTDFGQALEMVPNRLQQTYIDAIDVDVVNLYFIDWELLAHSWLHSWRADPIGKPGLSDKRQISGDVTLVVLNEEGLGVIADLDPTIAVVV